MPKASKNPTQRPRPRERSAAASEPRTALDVAERILSVAVVVFLAVAVLGFAATMAHLGLAGSVPFFAATAWQFAYWLPLVALPIAIVCLVALVAVSAAGKARRR